MRGAEDLQEGPPLRCACQGGWHITGENQEPFDSSSRQRSSAGQLRARPSPVRFCTAWISPNYTTSTYAAAGNFMWEKTSLDCSL